MVISLINSFAEALSPDDSSPDQSHTLCIMAMQQLPPTVFQYKIADFDEIIS